MTRPTGGLAEIKLAQRRRGQAEESVRGYMASKRSLPETAGGDGTAVRAGREGSMPYIGAER